MYMSVICVSHGAICISDAVPFASVTLTSQVHPSLCNVQIDFASRECQSNFLDRMEKTGQMRPENRPDERGLHKFRQRSFEYQEGFPEE